MKVRAKRKHMNAFGDRPVKNPGREYDAPEPWARALIEQGLVDEVADTPADDGAHGPG